MTEFSGKVKEYLEAEIVALMQDLPALKHNKWVGRSLANIVQMSKTESDRLDWKILSNSLQDLRRGFELFYPYRHTRKIAIFGSARTPTNAPEYNMALEFAQCVSSQGFMVITGAGGGIMRAGNEGAGTAQSFGLNIKLPFEQTSNQFITGDRKLLEFKYFFTRKLFFLRESDALAIFPGGFGTLDETFECLTLMQSGKFGPAPLIFIDAPGGDYWHDWQHFIDKQLIKKGLISESDQSLYLITDRLDVACDAISSFYQLYHSSRYVGEVLVLRMKAELSDGDIALLNDEFADILIKGKIAKSKALPEEIGDPTTSLPRLALYFNQRNFGRLYQLIARINDLGSDLPACGHPEQK